MTSTPSGLFNQCVSLYNVVLPSTITHLGDSTFNYCLSPFTLHLKATTPPTLGTYVFLSVPANLIIYVPVGTAETYKAASGWSTYADHILEEGQTPNRAMLAKFNSENTDNEEMR